MICRDASALGVAEENGESGMRTSGSSFDKLETRNCAGHFHENLVVGQQLSIFVQGFLPEVDEKILEHISKYPQGVIRRNRKQNCRRRVGLTRPRLHRVGNLSAEINPQIDQAPRWELRLAEVLRSEPRRSTK